MILAHVNTAYMTFPVIIQSGTQMDNYHNGSLGLPSMLNLGARQTVRRGIPMATPHFGPLWTAFFFGHMTYSAIKSTKVLVCSIFATLGIVKGNTFNFDNTCIVEPWNRCWKDCNIGNMWPMAAFFQKVWTAAFLWESYDKQLCLKCL